MPTRGRDSLPVIVCDMLDLKDAELARLEAELSRLKQILREHNISF